MRKIRLDRRFLKFGIACFLIGAVLGFWILSMYDANETGYSGMLSEYFIRQYKYVSFDGLELFYYILKHKLNWMLLLLALGYTAAGRASVLVWCTWLGILGGILVGLGVTRFGAFGVLFCLAAMLPQSLFYVPAWILVLNFVWKKTRRITTEKRLRTIRNLDWNYLLAAILGITMLLLGILTESYINPWLMKQVLQFF